MPKDEVKSYGRPSIVRYPSAAEWKIDKRWGSQVKDTTAYTVRRRGDNVCLETDAISMDFPLDVAIILIKALHEAVEWSYPTTSQN